MVSVLNFTLIKDPGRNIENKNNLDGKNGRQNWFVGTEYKSEVCTALSRGDCRGKVVRK